MRVKYVVNRLVNDRFLVGMIGVVMNDKNEVMVLKHTYRHNVPHGLPSGWLNADDSIEDALPREVKEETGLDVAFMRVLHVERSKLEKKIDIWVLARATGGQFRASDEVSEAAFYSLDALPKLLRSQQNFLRARRDEIEGQRP